MVNDKTSLRRHLRAQRGARPDAERRSAAAALVTHLLPHLDGARVVAAHAPSADEPGHGRLPAALSRLGARVLLPVVPASGHELAWAVHDGELVPGRYGLLEPLGPRLPAAALGQADVVIVPALAVGRDGTRLGRGGGWYDRALLHAAPTAVLVALLFEEELRTEVPTEDHDRRVDAVVTPDGGWVQLPG